MSTGSNSSASPAMRSTTWLGTPLCLDCYDYPHKVVWHMQAPELWRRITLAMTRHIRRTAKARGLHPHSVRLSFGKVAEMQRRGVVHFHAIIRLDGLQTTRSGGDAATCAIAA